MSTIVTRAGKGSALTHNEVDANFINLNTDKIEAAQSVTLTNKTISGSNNTLSNIGNASLTNSSVTIGSTSVSLGSTATTVSGLTLSSPTISGGTVDNASVGATTPSTGSFTSLTDSGNLTFTGTGNRITGDFTNATIANRVMFQTSTVNGNTLVGAIPNGTANASAVVTFNAADPGNASRLSIQTQATEAQIVSTFSGTGTYLPMTFYTGGSERMRIDTSGNVGIGTSSPVSRLTVAGSSAVLSLIDTDRTVNTYGAVWADQAGNVFLNADYDGTAGGAFISFRSNGSSASAEKMRIDSSGNVGIGGAPANGMLELFKTSGEAVLRINNTASSAWLTLNGATAGYIHNITNTPTVFTTNGTERARINSGGEFLVGKTSDDSSVAGSALRPTGVIVAAASGLAPILCNRLTNDGNLVEFYQATTLEGAISVSGTTVTYGGGHLARFSQLPDGSKDETLLKGTVLTNLDEMCVWINKETGEPADNEQCNKVKVSDVEGDASVAGVFVSWTYDEQHDTNDLFVAMTGDMIIRIAQGVTVQKGDLLMSSGDGTAKPQGDDIVRSKTIAKVTSNHVTCTYDDGSYCVPCVLMAC